MNALALDLDIGPIKGFQISHEHHIPWVFIGMKVAVFLLLAALYLVLLSLAWDLFMT